MRKVMLSPIKVKPTPQSTLSPTSFGNLALQSVRTRIANLLKQKNLIPDEKVLWSIIRPIIEFEPRVLYVEPNPLNLAVKSTTEDTFEGQSVKEKNININKDKDNNKDKDSVQFNVLAYAYENHKYFVFSSLVEYISQSSDERLLANLYEPYINNQGETIPHLYWLLLHTNQTLFYSLVEQHVIQSNLNFDFLQDAPHFCGLISNSSVFQLNTITQYLIGFINAQDKSAFCQSFKDEMIDADLDSLEQQLNTMQIGIDGLPNKEPEPVVSLAPNRQSPQNAALVKSSLLDLQSYVDMPSSPDSFKDLKNDESHDAENLSAKQKIDASVKEAPSFVDCYVKGVSLKSYLADSKNAQKFVGDFLVDDSNQKVELFWKDVRDKKRNVIAKECIHEMIKTVINPDFKSKMSSEAFSQILTKVYSLVIEFDLYNEYHLLNKYFTESSDLRFIPESGCVLSKEEYIEQMGKKDRFSLNTLAHLSKPAAYSKVFSDGKNMFKAYLPSAGHGEDVSSKDALDQSNDLNNKNNPNSNPNQDKNKKSNSSTRVIKRLL